MKQIRKTLILSALVALAFGGAAIGTTYAIFTGKADNNVTIQAGKVALTATPSELKLYSMGVLQTGTTFENGGTASISEDGSIVLDRMTPGDKVEFKTAFANISNVKTKYIFSVGKHGGLASALTVSGAEEVKTWTNLEPGAAPSSQAITVEMPESVGDSYQGMNGKITFNCYAVQQNATISTISDGEALKAIIENGTGDTPAVLSSDIDISSSEFTTDATTGIFATVAAGKKVILDLNGHTVTANSDITAKHVYFIQNSGDVVINDSSAAGDGTITLDSPVDTSWAHQSALIYNYANFTLNGGILSNTSDNAPENDGAASGLTFTIENYSGYGYTPVTTINKGEVTCDGYAAIREYCSGETEDNIVNIHGGKVYGAGKGIYIQNPTVDKAHKGTLNMDGGLVEGYRLSLFMEEVDTHKAIDGKDPSLVANLTGGTLKSHVAFNNNIRGFIVRYATGTKVNRTSGLTFDGTGAKEVTFACETATDDYTFVTVEA